MTPDTSALRLEGNLALREGRWEAALAHFAEIVRIAPSDHRSRMRAGRALVKMGERERAVTAFHACAEGLLRRDFLLSAIAACKLGLHENPTERRLLDTLGQVHARASAHASGRPAAAPPPPDVEHPSAGATLLGLTGDELVSAAMEILAFEDETGLLAPPAARPPLPLFADIPVEAFIELARRIDYREMKGGEVVFTEGVNGRSAYMLVAGRARVLQKTDEGPREIGSLSGGAMFGETALLADSPRATTIECHIDSELFEITRDHVEEVAHHHPGVLTQIAEFARRRMLAGVLRASPLFRAFTLDSQRAEILGEFSSRSARPGEVIIEEGKGGEGLFLVVNGELEVSKDDGVGGRVVLGYLRDGHVCGEISLLHGRPAIARVTATRKTTLAFLDGKRFDHVVNRYPQIGAYLDSLTDERLAATRQAMRPAEIMDADELLV